MENTNNLQPEIKEYPIVKKVLMIVAVGIAILCTLKTGQALFKDTTLETLEANYRSALTSREKNSKVLDAAKDAYDSSLDTECKARQALASYKLTKGALEGAEEHRLRSIVMSCDAAF